MSKLEKVYRRIDDDLEKHIIKLQEFIGQPSISQTGEGVRECAECLKGYLTKLGCQKAKLVEGQHSPIVYAEYNAGAEKTVIIYMMYDVQPAEDTHLWKVPPFEARLVEMPPFKKVLMARGAINTKGPLVAFINAATAIKDVDEIPVNLIFVAEGEEERASVSIPQFVRDHRDELKKADAVYFPIACQDENGLAEPALGSEGILYVELETSGAHWGRGPTEFGVHGALKLIIDSPAWRHIKMLSTLVSEDGNKIKIDGWHDDIRVPATEDLKLLRNGYRKSTPAVEVYDPNLIKKMLKIKVFIDDIADKEEIIKRFVFGTSFNLDGIWGGWIGPGSKTFVPHKVTSKHNIRFVPRQDIDNLFRKIRTHLDEKGYKDVELRKLGGYPWALVDHKNEIAEAAYTMFEQFKVKYAIYPPTASPLMLYPAWPAYVFAGKPLRLPLIGAALGHGGRAHSPNEYFVIEGADARHGRVYGLAGVEKSMAALLFNYTGKA
ncbi:MAG: M20/M25/M40 family metallo-hydrolase [Candidatus Bathyarchaeota archaeon]|nr:MAG: M20/M25/M40 family metallo-hydrolase [Candidatus Bathyarchaeota archaeon]